MNPTYFKGVREDKRNTEVIHDKYSVIATLITETNRVRRLRRWVPQSSCTLMTHQKRRRTSKKTVRKPPKKFSNSNMRTSTHTLINLTKISDPRGNLTFIEGGIHIPFEIKRVFYLYDVPSGADRGGHSLKTCHQLLIAVSGSFDVILNNGKTNTKITLNRPYYGLHISPLIWREMENFSSGAVCLVLASEKYDESDYYRRYDTYVREMHLKQNTK